MKIGVCGLGVVGKAIYIGFAKLGHKMSHYDKADTSKLADILDTEISFICVPTPSLKDGGCDTTIVENIVRDLNKNNYQGLIAIKSTVTPGTTLNLINKYKKRKICYVPEFLRERCAINDFTDYIKEQTLGKELEIANNDNYNFIYQHQLNGENLNINISKNETN